MIIDLQNDPSKGPGYGILTFSQIMAPDSPWFISIQRSSDHNFVTQTGKWVGENFFMTIPGEATSSGELTFPLGPEIIDALDNNERYRVSIKGEGGDLQHGLLNIISIVHSQETSLDNTARPEEKPLRKETPVTPAPPAPEPAPIPEPSPHRAPDEPELPLTPPPQAKAKNAWWRYAIIALLALGALAWYWFDPRNKSEETTAPVVAEEKSDEPKETPDTPKSMSAQERVDRFFASNDKSAAGAMKLYTEIPKSTEADQDAAYRLLYFASENGDAQGLLEYGKALDPSQGKWGSIEKDGFLAYTAYAKAIEGNAEGAKAAQDNLIDWLNKESQAGNSKARGWLNDIKP